MSRGFADATFSSFVLARKAAGTCQASKLSAIEFKLMEETIGILCCVVGAAAAAAAGAIAISIEEPFIIGLSYVYTYVRLNSRRIIYNHFILPSLFFVVVVSMIYRFKIDVYHVKA